MIEETDEENTFQIRNIHCDDVIAYLGFLDNGMILANHVESSSMLMLGKLSTSQAMRSRQDGAVFTRLCRLLLANFTFFHDRAFEREISSTMQTYVEQKPMADFRLSLQLGVQMWQMGPITHDIDSCLAIGMAAGITDEELEDLDTRFVPDLALAIRKARPKWITVIVGKGEEQRVFRFEIAKDCGSSGLLIRVCNTHRLRDFGEPMSLALAEEEPLAVARYLVYIRNRGSNLFELVGCKNDMQTGTYRPVTWEDGIEAVHHLIKLWLLGGRLEDPSFQNKVMDFLVQHWCQTKMDLKLETILLIAEKDGEGGVLMKWLVDSLNPIEYDFLQREGDKLPHSLLLAMMKKQVQIRDARDNGEDDIVPPKWEDRFEYHV